MEFTYNASAVAAGGVLQTPDGNKVIVPSLASVALAPTGGEGVSVQRNYVSEALSFSYAETRVFGREVSPDVFTTETDVYITNLNVLNVLSIALLRATIRSTRSFSEDDDHVFDLEATYHGVGVRKPKESKYREIAPKVDVTMKSVKRYKHLEHLLGAPEGVGTLETPDGAMFVPCPTKRDLLDRFDLPETDEAKQKLKEHLAKGRPILGSLIEHVEEAPSTVSVSPIDRRRHKLYIPGVGNLRFGELMLKPGRRRVNLIRVQLGSPEFTLLQDVIENESPDSEIFSGGSLTVGSVEGNGAPLWP